MKPVNIAAMIVLLTGILCHSAPFSCGEAPDNLDESELKRYDIRQDAIRDLFDEYLQVKEKRQKAVDSKGQNDAFKARLAGIEGEIKSLYGRFDSLNVELSNVRPGDAIANNKIVAELNLVNSRMMKLNNEAKDIIKSNEGSERSYGAAMGDYETALFALAGKFGSFDTPENRARYNNDEEYVCRNISEGLSSMKNDFAAKDIETTTTERGIMVDAVINDDQRVRLLVDTGASVVLLRKGVADRLNIGLGKIESRMFCTLADGSQVEAVPVIFDSVDVNGFKVNKVYGAVFDGSVGADVDGLLGMSYLGNFIFRIDPKSNKIILEKFDPGMK